MSDNKKQADKFLNDPNSKYLFSHPETPAQNRHYRKKLAIAGKEIILESVPHEFYNRIFRITVPGYEETDKHLRRVIATRAVDGCSVLPCDTRVYRPSSPQVIEFYPDESGKMPNRLPGHLDFSNADHRTKLFFALESDLRAIGVAIPDGDALSDFAARAKLEMQGIKPGVSLLDIQTIVDATVDRLNTKGLLQSGVNAEMLDDIASTIFRQHNQRTR